MSVLMELFLLASNTAHCFYWKFQEHSLII